MHSEILSKTDREEALAFYQSSRLRVSAELKHIDSMLRKLGGENTNEKTGVVLTLKGTKAKKRGPKSVWGKFILEKLKEQNHLYNHPFLNRRTLVKMLIWRRIFLLIYFSLFLIFKFNLLFFLILDKTL